jgi:MerR family transcriptional regulator, light-induced transcriptional regulator
MSNDNKLWDSASTDSDRAAESKQTQRDLTSSDWRGEQGSRLDYGAERPASSGDRERQTNERASEARAIDRQEKLDRREMELARAIEAEIIPRLLISNLAKRTIKAVTEAARPAEPMVLSEQDIDLFSRLVMDKPLNAAVAHIDGLLAGGMTVETMILDVLSPTARHLGVRWERDEITFVDVTLGLSRLQQLLRVYGPAFEIDFAPDHKGHRILLAAMPGEQHTFGMSVVEEFFRRDGWDVNTEANISRALLIGRIEDEWFDVVGLSASGDASVALLSPLITAIRKASLNRHVRVIVGGCPFLAEPANALAMGADMVACNGREAVLNVDRLLNAHPLQ